MQHERRKSHRGKRSAECESVLFIVNLTKQSVKIICNCQRNVKTFSVLICIFFLCFPEFLQSVFFFAVHSKFAECILKAEGYLSKLEILSRVRRQRDCFPTVRRKTKKNKKKKPSAPKKSKAIEDSPCVPGLWNNSVQSATKY